MSYVAIGKQVVRGTFHSAPDFAWMKVGATHSQFRNQMDSSHCAAPKLMSQYLQTASACCQKEKYSFVHAQSALFRFPRVFFEELNGKNSGFYRYLRYPGQQYAVESHQVMEKVREYVGKNGSISWTHGSWGQCTSRPDDHLALQPYLVSLSYALAQCGQYETASHFLFSNSSITGPEKIEGMVEQAVTRTLRVRGKSEKIPIVLETFRKLKADYLSLKWGTAYVIGIPKHLAEVVYDSKSFGIPTGVPIEQAVIRAHEYPNAFSGEEGGCQARLILCRTTMDPKSGIDVVDVTETSEVQRYCQGHTIVPPEEIDVYRPFFCDKNETNENEEMQKRRMLDEKVKSLARFVAS